MDADVTAIRELVDTWLRATREGDEATVLGLMAENVVFLVAGRPPMCGRDAFAAALSRMRDLEIDGEADIQEIQVIGEWAYCWNYLTVSFQPKNGGPSGKRAGHVLTVLKKEDGRWFIFRDANLLTAADS